MQFNNSSKFKNYLKGALQKSKFQLTLSPVQKLNMSIELKKFENKLLVDMKAFDDT